MSEFFNWSRISANATLKKKHLQYFNSLHWREVKKNKCVASVNLGSIHWKSEPRSYCCVLVVPFLPIFNWVFVVSTPLKILVTMGIFPKIGVKVKTSWNQHPENHFNQIRDTNFNQIQIQLLWTACNWQVFSCRNWSLANAPKFSYTVAHSTQTSIDQYLHKIENYDKPSDLNMSHNMSSLFTADLPLVAAFHLYTFHLQLYRGVPGQPPTKATQLSTCQNVGRARPDALQPSK